MKTIVLTGMMGSGKTTIGKILAEIYNVEFIDTDEKIEQTQNKTITEIFSQKGEPFFRELEVSTIKQIFKPENLIISLGGGAFENLQTREFLLNNSTVIYLETSAQNILKRIKTTTSRPLLNNNMTLEKISQILNQRTKNYQTATITINTNFKNPSEIVNEIRSFIK